MYDLQSTYNFDEGFCRDEVVRGLPSPASLLINFDLLLVQHDSCSAGTHTFSSPSWRCSSQPSGDDQFGISATKGKPATSLWPWRKVKPDGDLYSKLLIIGLSEQSRPCHDIS
ncbi:hypothetical protein FOZG_09774 [Fusarium oxysporum Fo47]|uniref:Uncharacterized protein n=1 Tax=Fusarium oxysporum Fo47 TaxID=660027 RepID=W9K0P1_FUSOX|nr:hypothetical protein FOZG_09774 [Fusarium oxysporum Fo47]